MSFDELLAKHLEGLDSYTANVEAERFCDFLREHYPEVLDAWVAEKVVYWVTRAIGEYDRRERGKARRRAGARDFADRTERAERGDDSGLRTFEIPYVVSDSNEKKRVGDMTGSDHRFVAAGYSASAKRDRMLAQFHLAVAKKVGRKRTADVLSEEQYEALLVSITGQAA